MEKGIERELAEMMGTENQGEWRHSKKAERHQRAAEVKQRGSLTSQTLVELAENAILQ